MKKLLVVDSRLIAYLTFHRKEDIFKTFRYIVSYVEDYLPFDKMVIAFDSPKGSIKRQTLYKDYKAHRRAREKTQTEEEQERLKTFNKDYMNLYPLFSYLASPILLDGFEADDIANIISYKFKDNYKVYLLSSDSDWAMNLISDNITQIHLTKGFINRANCFDVYSKKPDDIVFIQAICGIAKENVKGVFKFGETRCKKLLYKENLTHEEIISTVQDWVNNKKYGCSLPTDYNTVKELFDFNYNLLKPIQLEELDKTTQDSLVQQFNHKPTYDLDELDTKAIELFNRPLMLDIFDFYKYKKEQ